VTQPILLTTQTGESRPTTFGALVGSIDSATLAPISEIVGIDTSLKVTLKTKNAIPKKGKILITISEYWNQGAIDNLKEYFTSITCDTMRVGLRTIDASLFDCNFFTEPSKVVISGAFDTGIVREGSEISFNINGFRNPIQANTNFDVFNIYTTGENERYTVD